MICCQSNTTNTKVIYNIIQFSITCCQLAQNREWLKCLVSGTYHFVVFAIILAIANFNSNVQN